MLIGDFDYDLPAELIAQAYPLVEPEPSAEDQPNNSLIPELTAGHEGGAPEGMTPDEREARSRLGRYLTRSAFPADRATLTAAARAAQNGFAPRWRRHKNPNRISWLHRA